MALRRSFACLLAALAVCAWTACKGKGDTAKTGGDLDQRCDQLAKTCGDTDKHVEKLAEGCKQAAADPKTKGCTDKVTALYDCYEKELCGKADKIWAVEDLRVLAERNNKCVVERKAVADCGSAK